MYARLRGVVPALIPSTVDSLLSRLDLTQFADRCDSQNSHWTFILFPAAACTAFLLQRPYSTLSFDLAEKDMI